MSEEVDMQATELQQLRVKEMILGTACQQVMAILNNDADESDDRWIGEIHGILWLALSASGRELAKPAPEVAAKR